MPSAHEPVSPRRGSAPCKEAPEVVISPGEFHVTNRSVVIRTLLGSCVAACLYDPGAGVVGMNHFLLSNHRYARDLPSCVTEAGRYGIHAMELVINGMLKLGARRHGLKAKAFGGGSILPHSVADNFFCVGDVNVKFIREFLAAEKIPLVASDLGGVEGRVIYFSTVDHSVHVRKIRRDRSVRVAERDRAFWQQRVATQETAAPAPELW